MQASPPHTPGVLVTQLVAVAIGHPPYLVPIHPTAPSCVSARNPSRTGVRWQRALQRRPLQTHKTLDNHPMVYSSAVPPLAAMTMSDVTRILSALEHGDPHAADQ